MRTISGVLLAVLLLAAGIPSHAQAVTESEFLADVLSTHPGARIAAAELAASSGARRQAGAFSNPELSWEREDPDTASRQDSWRLSWQLPFDGRSHRVAEAEARQAAARKTLDATRLDIRLEMRELYADWYIASQRAELLERHFEQTRRLAAWLKARAEIGEAAGVEARRLELELELRSRQLAQARAEAAARQAAAAAWSELVRADSHPLRPELAPPPSAADLAQRPDLAALEHEVAASEARSRLAGRRFASPELSLGWLELHEEARSVEGPIFSIAWPLPLFDRKQGRRQAAAAAVDRSRAVLEDARRHARQNAEAALAAYEELYRSATQQSSRSADFGLTGPVRAAFEAGEASLTELLDALHSSLALQLARLESLASALAAERRLEAALGHPILPGGSS